MQPMNGSMHTATKSQAAGAWGQFPAYQPADAAWSQYPAGYGGYPNQEWQCSHMTSYTEPNCEQNWNYYNAQDNDGYQYYDSSSWYSTTPYAGKWNYATTNTAQPGWSMASGAKNRLPTLLENSSFDDMQKKQWEAAEAQRLAAWERDRLAQWAAYYECDRQWAWHWYAEGVERQAAWNAFWAYEESERNSI